MNLLFQSIKIDNSPRIKGKAFGKSSVTLMLVTPAEYRGGHIKGAKNVPLQSINRYDGDKETVM